MVLCVIGLCDVVWGCGVLYCVALRCLLLCGVLFCVFLRFLVLCDVFYAVLCFLRCDVVKMFHLCHTSITSNFPVRIIVFFPQFFFFFYFNFFFCFFFLF